MCGWQSSVSHKKTPQEYIAAVAPIEIEGTVAVCHGGTDLDCNAGSVGVSWFLWSVRTSNQFLVPSFVTRVSGSRNSLGC
jgi:hypothetical protein